MADHCIVGAGPGGLAATRAFLAQGLDVDCFERHDDVGGIWDQDNPGSADVRLGALHLLALDVGLPRVPDARRPAGLPLPPPGAGLPARVRPRLRPVPRDRARDRRRACRAGGRRLDRHALHGRDAPLPHARLRERHDLAPEHAGAPRRRDVHRRAAALARLPQQRAVRAAGASSSSAPGTRASTSPATRRPPPAPPRSACAAGTTSSRSTCSARRPTSSPTRARICRCPSPSASSPGSCARRSATRRSTAGRSRTTACSRRTRSSTTRSSITCVTATSRCGPT